VRSARWPCAIRKWAKGTNGKPTWPFTLQTAARATPLGAAYAAGVEAHARARQAGGGTLSDGPRRANADNDGEGDDFPFGANATAMASRWPKATKTPCESVPWPTWFLTGNHS